MVLLPCHECGREISHTSESCRWCGYKPKPGEYEPEAEIVMEELRRKAAERQWLEERKWKHSLVSCLIFLVIFALFLLIYWYTQRR